MEILYEQIRTKNALSQNCSALLVLRFACKASACQFGLTHFFNEFANAQLFAIFHGILRLRIDSCFVLGKWDRMGGDWVKAKWIRNCADYKKSHFKLKWLCNISEINTILHWFFTSGIKCYLICTTVFITTKRHS